MRERDTLICPDSEEILQLHIALTSDKTIFSSLNEDGVDVLNRLLSGKTIGQIVSDISSEKPRSPRNKVEQQVVTFLRRLYCRGLIKTTLEDGEIKIPSWMMEPLVDAHLSITHNCNLDCIHCLIVKEKGKCSFCPMLKYCTPCPGFSFWEQGNFRESPQWCCDITKLEVRKYQEGGDK